jgi:type IV pilus assembly protein PilA
MSLFCAGCGNSMTAGDQFCRVCGRQTASGAAVTSATSAPPLPVGPPQTSGKAIVSLICGLFFLFFPVSIVAIVFGHLSLSEIRKSAGRLTGSGLAIAGLVLGYAGLAVIPVLIIAAIAIPNLLRARMAANESSAITGVHRLNVAEAVYSQAHHEAGYTCSLSDLDQSIDRELVKGQKYGYVFELKGCSVGPEGGPNMKYQVVAYPISVNQTGMRAFCSDESAVIRAEPGGSASECVDHGSLLQQ